MRRSVALLVAAALAAGVSGAAQAGLPYSTGFEPPTFSSGPIAGQDGWNTFSASGQGALAAVTTAAALSGTQSLGVSATAAAQTGGFYDFGATGGATTLVMSGDIMVDSAGSNAEYQFATLGPGLFPFASGIDWATGTIIAITAGFPVIGTFSSNVWHHVEIDSNLATQTFDVRLDGATLASGLAFCGDNSGCAGGPVTTLENAFFDTFGGQTAGAGYLDNFSLSAAPEPAAWALMLAGFALAGAALRRRRLSLA